MVSHHNCSNVTFETINKKISSNSSVKLWIMANYVMDKVIKFPNILRKTTILTNMEKMPKQKMVLAPSKLIRISLIEIYQDKAIGCMPNDSNQKAAKETKCITTRFMKCT